MIRSIALLLLLLAGCAASAPAARDVDDFSRGVPEAEGVDPSAILSFVDAADNVYVFRRTG